MEKTQGEGYLWAMEHLRLPDARREAGSRLALKPPTSSRTETVRFCCLSHSAGGVLLQRP